MSWVRLQTLVYLFILGEAAHHSWVHDAIKQHGEGVDGKAPVSLILVNHGKNLLIGGFHGLYGILQWRQGSLGERRQKSRESRGKEAKEVREFKKKRMRWGTYYTEEKVNAQVKHGIQTSPH